MVTPRLEQSPAALLGNDLPRIGNCKDDIPLNALKIAVLQRNLNPRFIVTKLRNHKDIINRYLPGSDQAHRLPDAADDCTAPVRSVVLTEAIDNQVVA